MLLPTLYILLERYLIIVWLSVYQSLHWGNIDCRCPHDLRRVYSYCCDIIRLDNVPDISQKTFWMHFHSHVSFISLIALLSEVSSFAGEHCCRYWLYIVNRILRNKLQWNVNEIPKFSFKKICLKNLILPWPQCVNIKPVAIKPVHDLSANIVENMTTRLTLMIRQITLALYRRLT